MLAAGHRNCERPLARVQERAATLGWTHGSDDGGYWARWQRLVCGQRLVLCGVLDASVTRFACLRMLATAQTSRRLADVPIGLDGWPQCLLDACAGHPPVLQFVRRIHHVRRCERPTLKSRSELSVVGAWSEIVVVESSGQHVEST